jgi:hypothetical protein
MEIAEVEYRGFRIVGDKTYGNKLIKQRGKGDIPHKLKGSYTNAPFAKSDIDKYLDQPKAKAKAEKVEDAKSTSSS